MSAAREIRRLRYLQAMGLPVYVSKRALPGAAQSSVLLHRIRREQETRRENAGVAKPGTASSSRSERVTPGSLRRDAAASISSQANRAPVVPRKAERAAGDPDAGSNADVTPETRSSPQTPARFCLAIVVHAQRLWVEDLGEDALATDQLRLLAAIGNALTHPVIDPGTPRATQFVWPLHDNQQLDQGEAEAAASLQGFLARQMDEHACVEVLCLGTPAAQRLRALALPCARRELPATRDMLQDPMLKRSLWEELRS